MELFGDRLCHFLGQQNRITSFSIEAVRPNVRVGGSIDQLDSHVHPVARPGNRAFEYAVNPKLAAYLSQRPVGSLVLHDGCS
jgi:hypothetical protein